MAVHHWIEVLTCPKCGETGLAELWDAPAFEGQADLVPPGFRAVYRIHGREFHCSDCGVLATSELR